jgi:hypothetical protein
MASAYIEKRKRQHKCTKCRQDAPLGQSVCFDCVDKMAAAKAVRQAQGLCIQCWRTPAIEGRRMCDGCRMRTNQRVHIRKQAWKAAGLCVKCGKAPPYHAHAVCAKCWAKRHGL